MKRRIAYLVFVIMILSNSAYCEQASESLKPFKSGSLQAIEQSRAGQAFFIVLWALDCPPCRKELELLGQLQRQHENLPLVLISTDDIGQRNEVMAVLDKYSLANADAWIFADSYTERLRHAIDPQWYGELPRSYFYDRHHARRAVSGILKERELKDWLRETGRVKQASNPDAAERSPGDS